jgi:DNA-directed RNA polymerase specialized sigma subunit
MTAKEYLRQYLDADRAINAKLEQIRRLRELATKTTQTLQPDKVQSSNENKTEKIIAKIVDLENEVDAEIDRLVDIKAQIEAVIRQVPDATQRIVLERRYINGERWKDIAVKMYYSYMQIYRIHGKALQKVEDVIECYTPSMI